MGFGSRLRKKVKRAWRSPYAAGYYFKKGEQLGRHARKKVVGTIKKNPALFGTAVGAAFGAPMLGASLGGIFGGQGSPDFGSYYPQSDEGYSMAEEPSTSESLPAPDASAESSGFAPAMDKKWLVIGGIALIAILLLMKKKD
jgi:hypothetical protein